MRLGELLEAIPRDMPLMLDVKAYADHDLAARTANRSCEIVAEHGTAERAQIVSFFSSGCRAAGDHGVRSRLVAWADYAPQDLARWAMKIGAFGVSFEGFVFSSDLCRALRQQGLSVALGTVNHREQLEALLPLEPEVLVSDCPHELRRVLDEG